MEVMIEFIRIHPLLLDGKTHPLNINEVEEAWDNLVLMLNEVGNGARKDKKQWKTFFTEWKSKTKKKARVNKNCITKTGGGGYKNEQLTNIENRLMNVIGWISVIGCGDLPEEIDPNQTNCEQVGTSSNTNVMQVTEEYVVLEDGNLEVVEDHDYTVIDNDIQSLNSDDQTPKPVIPTSKSKFKNRMYKKVNAPSSHLQKCAEMYALSANSLSESMKTMADSMLQLATAVKSLSEAIASKT
ncbi:hypothetical protein RN001_007622 [Aquatica leii]|uniref:Regulatory protein zeste n=1 Tax=Aquatica leii TaxID=1421715 RepID=A0AAN7PBY9_9COLE|nr:hypothetical protein RN001_007622 [Aquatica leii]